LGAAGVLLVIQLAFTYLPFINTLFGTVPIPLVEWSLLSLVGLGVFLIVEVEKAVLRWGRADPVRSHPST
jgi:Ca2+-transporting ATPase